MGGEPRLRVLVFVVAFDAERTIADVLRRVPHELASRYELEVLVIDDASTDATFDRGDALRVHERLPFPLRVLVNPVNQGYGGNQKLGFRYAIDHGFDAVVLLHGDGQYAPESLPDLLEPIAAGRADAVMGSRMLTAGGARRGGMPLYKLIGNRVLTAVQNRLLRSRLSEFHSGYRVYSTEALQAVPFALNSNGFSFDTEILIQLLRGGFRIEEVPIPTYYGDEISHVNGLAYARDVVLASATARVQELDLVYDRKFDCAPAARPNERYRTKLDYASTHTRTLELIRPPARVLELGCGDGLLAQALKQRGCYVAGLDAWPLAPGVTLDEFHLHDLDSGPLPLRAADFDWVLLLDVVEHLRDPEAFIAELGRDAAENPDLTLLVSSGNVGFLPMRLLLLAGQFNYGRRGILDLTHTRLYTFSTLRRLLEGGGFRIERALGVPAPFPQAIGEGSAGRLLLRVNESLIALRRQMFAYQSFFVARPWPSVPYLLREAEAAAARRAHAAAAAAGG